MRSALMVTVMGLTLASSDAARTATADNLQIALNLADLLRASRAVIAANQDLINDPGGGDKGLTGTFVLDEAIARFRNDTSLDPGTIDSSNRRGRLLQAQMAAIREVVDEQQQLINRRDIGFKGFVPAVFARMVNERFEAKVGDLAQVKVTAPPDLVRNRSALPDAWETEFINTKLLDPAWPKGEIVAVEARSEGRAVFRVLVPEYYTAGCLDCHGGPKGEIDITGYPKEGGQLGDLGGVISISLFR